MDGWEGGQQQAQAGGFGRRWLSLPLLKTCILPAIKEKNSPRHSGRTGSLICSITLPTHCMPPMPKREEKKDTLHSPHLGLIIFLSCIQMLYLSHTFCTALCAFFLPPAAARNRDLACACACLYVYLAHCLCPACHPSSHRTYPLGPHSPSLFL